MNGLNSEPYPQFTDKEDEASICFHPSQTAYLFCAETEPQPGLSDSVEASLSGEVTDSWRIWGLGKRCKVQNSDMHTLVLAYLKWVENFKNPSLSAATQEVLSGTSFFRTFMSWRLALWREWNNKGQKNVVWVITTTKWHLMSPHKSTNKCDLQQHFLNSGVAPNCRQHHS